MRASAVRFCPCSCLIAPEVVWTAIHAVAATEHAATSAETASSRPSRLRRNGTRPAARRAARDPSRS